MKLNKKKSRCTNNSKEKEIQIFLIHKINKNLSTKVKNQANEKEWKTFQT